MPTINEYLTSSQYVYFLYIKVFFEQALVQLLSQTSFDHDNKQDSNSESNFVLNKKWIEKLSTKMSIPGRRTNSLSMTYKFFFYLVDVAIPVL